MLEQGVVGRCTLTPPDPQWTELKGHPGFNPCICQVSERFQQLPFKMQFVPLLRRGPPGHGVVRRGQEPEADR